MSSIFKDYKIELTPIIPSGYYIAGNIFIKDRNENEFWRGEFKLSRTILSGWKIDGNDYNKIYLELGKLICGLRIAKDILPAFGGIIQIFSYDVGEKTYLEYTETIIEEIKTVFSGRALNKEEVDLIYKWSLNDIQQLKIAFNTEGDKFASSGYAIYLFCAIDIWGSVMKHQFGKRHSQLEHVGHALDVLQRTFSTDKYKFSKAEKVELVDLLRNNLIHNYGLRVLHTNDIEDWPNIDTSGIPVINKQTDGRWHVNCIELSNDLIEIISQWVEDNNV